MAQEKQQLKEEIERLNVQRLKVAHKALFDMAQERQQLEKKIELLDRQEEIELLNFKVAREAYLSTKICPTCNIAVHGICMCARQDYQCKNGHWFYYCNVHNKAFLGNTHYCNVHIKAFLGNTHNLSFDDECVCDL